MTQTQPAPITLADLRPIYVPVVAYLVGLAGDDVNVATATATTAYQPRNQGEKADMLGLPPANDVTTPRGWIDPAEPYNAAPVPTVTSLAPATRVHAPTADIVVTVTGTNFLPDSVVYFGPSMMRTTYNSPTQLSAVLKGTLFTGVDPAVPVTVQNADKVSNANITFAIT